MRTLFRFRLSTASFRPAVRTAAVAMPFFILANYYYCCKKNKTHRDIMFFFQPMPLTPPVFTQELKNISTKYHPRLPNHLPEDTNTNIFLVTTGAMNPPHPGHVLPIVNAIRQLTALGYYNVTAMICPCDDLYVQDKAEAAGRISLPYQERVALTQFLIENTITLSKDERKKIHIYCYQAERGCENHTHALEILQDQKTKSPTTCVMYVSGQDVSERMGWYLEGQGFPQIVTPRDDANNLSSTRLMDDLQTGDNTSYIISEINAVCPGYLNKLCEAIRYQRELKMRIFNAQIGCRS